MNFKDLYKNETINIVSCGPSLQDIDQDRLLIDCYKNPTFSIKQAFSVVGEEVDLHNFNCNNYTRYNTENCFSIACSSQLETKVRKFLWKDDKIDGFYFIDTKERLTKTLDFDKQIYREDNIKSYGPSILFETALPIAILAGAKKIKLFGVDLKPPGFKGYWNHFYSDRKNISGPIGIMKPQENDDIIRMSKFLYRYLLSKNISLEVCSHISNLDEEIPRNLSFIKK